MRYQDSLNAGWKPDVKLIRQTLGLSQSEFDRLFKLGLKNVQNWEQGFSKPASGKLTFLWLIEHHPLEILEMLWPYSGKNADINIIATIAKVRAKVQIST